jgi:DNA polymerase III delta prime subunit
VEAVEFSGRRRAAFLERVWSQRIVNGLERSLQHASEMYLGMRNTPDLVKPSYAQSTAEPGEVLGVEEAFDQAGGQLLIVGPPGSGKTTEALKLMRHLLEVARSDPSAPVPEVFPLASWAKERKPLLEWLADQLQLRHGWSPRQGRSLIWDHHVIPVLDGLDEVAPESRAECLEEINRFQGTYRDGSFVLCSREGEYEELSEKVQLGGAVTVCPPDAQQIDEYLAAAGSSWDGVRAQLRAGSSPLLRELLTTPLMLNIAVLAYQDQDPSELGEADDAAAQRERLWSHYVSAMTTRGYDPRRAEPPATALYTEEQVTRWLGWLAGEMRSRNETELWLHEWYGPTSFRRKVRLVMGLILGLGLGLGLGLPPNRHLKFDLVFGLVFAAAFGLLGMRTLNPRPAYRLPLRRRRLKRSLTRWLRVGLFFGPLLGAGFGVASVLVGAVTLGYFFAVSRGLAGGLVLGVGSGVTLGLVGSVVSFGTDRERVAPRSPIQLIADSCRIGIVVGLFIGGLVGLLLGPVTTPRVGIVFGTALGLVVALTFGLDCPLFHFAFRLWLRMHNCGPSRWLRFLEWTNVHLLLRRTGASYQWAHLELRDYLAARYGSTSEARSA